MMDQLQMGERAIGRCDELVGRGSRLPSVVAAQLGPD